MKRREFNDPPKWSLWLNPGAVMIWSRISFPVCGWELPLYSVDFILRLGLLSWWLQRPPAAPHSYQFIKLNWKRGTLSFLIVLSDGSGIKSCWPCLGHKSSPGPTTVSREMKCLEWPGLDYVLTSRTWEWDRPYMNHKWGWVFAQKGMRVSFIRRRGK